MLNNLTCYLTEFDLTVTLPSFKSFLGCVLYVEDDEAEVLFFDFSERLLDVGDVSVLTEELLGGFGWINFAAGHAALKLGQILLPVDNLEKNHLLSKQVKPSFTDYQLQGDSYPFLFLNVLKPSFSSMPTYQYQFVKTHLRRVWSNRDMELFSFWPISPQFAKESSPKPLKSVHPSGSHFGGPFSML